MALRTSRRKQAIPLADFAADIERRLIASDVTNMPRNSGMRRTESKRVLLAAIEKTGANW